MKKLLSYFFLIFPLSLIAQFSGNGPLGPTNGIWYWGTNVSGVQGRGMLNTNFLYIKDRLVDTNVLAERAWVTNNALLTVDAYGADPTGVSDSTAAFNRMLATSHLLMGTGTYLLPNGFTVSNGYSVRGVGSRATYIKTTTATNNGISFANVSGVNGVELKGFTVYNTLGGDTNTGVGIYMRMTNGNYSGAAHRVEDVMAAGFQQGIWAESIPQLRIERSGFVANRIGMHLTKADTALIQGILIAGRTNNGIGSVTPLITSTNYCLAMLVDNGTGVPGGTGFHVKVDTFEIGDVDRVLEINGSTPVMFENGNTERIGAVQAPPGGYSYVFVSNSIAPVTIEGWRTDSVPVGVTNSSAFIHVYADVNTGPFVRLSRMQRALIFLTANWVPIRVTGPGRASTTFVVDDQVVRIAKHSALGAAPDTGVSTNAFSGPINEVRSGGSFEGAWNSGILTFRDTGGGATPYIDFFTASQTRWRMYATSQSFFIRDVVNSDDQIEITPTTVIMPAATVTNLSVTNVDARGWVNIPAGGTSNSHAVNLSQLTTVSNAIVSQLATKLSTDGTNAADDFVIHDMFSVDLSENTITFSGGGTADFINMEDIAIGTGAEIRPGASGFLIHDTLENFTVNYTNNVWKFIGTAPWSEVTPTQPLHLTRLTDLTNSTTNPRRDVFVLYTSGFTNAATTGTNAMQAAPYNLRINTNEVMAAVNRHFAPTGSQMRFDILTNGVSILATPLHIDAAETTSLTAATNHAFLATGANTIARGTFIEIVNIQVGSTLPGSGANVTIPFTEVP